MSGRSSSAEERRRERLGDRGGGAAPEHALCRTKDRESSRGLPCSGHASSSCTSASKRRLRRPPAPCRSAIRTSIIINILRAREGWIPDRLGQPTPEAQILRFRSGAPKQIQIGCSFGCLLGSIGPFRVSILSGTELGQRPACGNFATSATAVRAEPA